MTHSRIGTWLSVGSPVIAELAALSGFDWVLFDLEHGSEPEAALPNQLRAIRRSATRGIVRVGAANRDLIARVLDWGADGIMVPHVESAAAAEAIVAAAYYAPRGRRGLSRTVRAHDYGLNPSDNAAATPIVMAQIESVAGVENVEAIARIDGIDVLFVGPADLRHDLKHHDSNHHAKPDLSYDDCLRGVLAAATSNGKSAGILVREIDAVPDHIERGFTHIAIDSDLAILRKAYQHMLSHSRHQS